MSSPNTLGSFARLRHCSSNALLNGALAEVVETSDPSAADDDDARVMAHVLEPAAIRSLFPEPLLLRPSSLGPVSLDLEQRSRIAGLLTDQLLSALACGLYPPPDVERVFGIEAPSADEERRRLPTTFASWPAGSLAFDAWRCLAVAGAAPRDDIVSQLLRGTLPSWLEASLRALPPRQATGRTAALLLRRCEGIPYDDMTLGSLCGWAAPYAETLRRRFAQPEAQSDSRRDYVADAAASAAAPAGGGAASG